MKYDTIIIGAGLSGLAAGIRLAYYEKSVCIVEKHYTIGGLNSFYRLRGRNYDVGLHAVTNYAPHDRKAPLSKLIRQLRLSWNDLDLSPQRESKVVFPGATLRFNNDFALFRSEVARLFPAEIDRFDRMVQLIDQMDIGKIQEESSTRSVLAEHLSDPLLIDMLLCPVMYYSSATPHDLEFRQFVIIFRSIFREGFARPRKGIRLILKHLVRKYKALGGELRLRSGVESIPIENGRAVGVVLESGEELTADNVLSSAGSPETMRLCRHEVADEDRFRPGEISFVELIFSLNEQPEQIGLNETAMFYSLTHEFHYAKPKEPVDLRGGIVCSPNNFLYDEPLDEGCVRITALANSDFWMSQPEDQYQADKLNWQNRIVASALDVLPDFRPHVIDTDMFTPRTIRKFTHHVNGCVYGAPRKHLDGKTPFAHLYLCGTDQGFLGIVGAMLSGISIANAYLLR